jgi:predicted transcriptional regulator
MRISDAESQIMDVLWERGPTSAEELIGEVGRANDWADGTVRTLINRLIQKKAIESHKEAGRAIYHPRTARADYVQRESQGLLNRLFKGEVAPLVVHFAEHRALTPKDIETLKALIARLEE